MNIYEATQQRRSIRRFTEQPVTDNILDKCIEAARMAPTGKNTQACEFITVNDPELLAGMFSNIGGSIKLPPEKGGPGPGNDPKAYTIILFNKKIEGDAARRNVSTFDAGMAAENIILVALEEGLGCCPLLMINRDGITSLLKIPDTYDIALVLAMGYPAETPVAEAAGDSLDSVVDANLVRHVPKRKLEDLIHRNGF